MKKQKFKIKCIGCGINTNTNEHVLSIRVTEQNKGMFGSKIIKSQFEKIESALSKNYIRLPFGVRILF